MPKELSQVKDGDEGVTLINPNAKSPGAENRTDYGDEDVASGMEAMKRRVRKEEAIKRHKDQSQRSPEDPNA